MKNKIVFFGTSKFAVPALEKLAQDSSYEIAAVVTQPDKPAGRKQELLPSPVKVAAEKSGLKILQFPKLEIENWKLKFPPAEIYIVASYGKIIPRSIIDLPQYGTLNIHPSLLPRYRGPSPIQTAILNGDEETGVSIMLLDEEMDHGPILESRKWEIENRIAFKKLHNQLADVGAELLAEILPKYLSSELKPRPQDHAHATFTKIITKGDGRIDWKKSADEIDRVVRAFGVWPVAWTTIDGKRLKIYETEIVSASNLKPGEIDEGLLVGAGKNALQLIELQLEGGKKQKNAEFLRGHSGLIGKILV